MNATTVSGPVSVMGLMDEGMGGLDESMAAFVEHHKKVADQLLNLSGIGTPEGKPVKKETPRAAYTPVPYPKRMHHPEGQEIDVASEKEKAAAVKAGFREEPYLKPRVALGSPEAEKKELIDRNTELAGKLAVQNDLLAKLSARLAALEAK